MILTNNWGATNMYKLAKNNLIKLVDITNLICIMSLMINLKLIIIING